MMKVRHLDHPYSMFERTLGVQNMHQTEISYVSTEMLNQPFKNKIGLSENTNINKNTHDENIEIKEVLKSEQVRPSTDTKKYIFRC